MDEWLEYMGIKGERGCMGRGVSGRDRDGCIDGWMDGQSMWGMDRWVDRWINTWMDGGVWIQARAHGYG